MHRFVGLSLGFLGLVGLLACQSTTAPPVDRGPAPAGDARPEPATSGAALVFPPAPEQRARRALPPTLRTAVVEPELAVVSPALDSNRHFEFAGATVSIELNSRVAPPTGEAPPVRIDPEVRGEARWSTWGLAFEADAPFDPETTYALTVGPVRDEHGRTSPEWKATFRADPQIRLGDKVISYIPQPGQPRVVAVRPFDGSKVSRVPELTVVFDQPIALEAAAPLLHLRRDETEIALRLRHATKRRLDGAAIDPKHVVLARPVPPLAAGRRYTFEAHDGTPTASEPEAVTLEVASALAFTEVECPAYGTEHCRWRPGADPGAQTGTLELEGQDLTLLFNNAIADEDAQLLARIEVEPAVRNLSAWKDGWSGDGRVYLSGGFEPSSRYTLRLAGVRDVYGSALADPVELSLETLPRSTSLAMLDGERLLDADQSGRFVVTTRNVARARLQGWVIDDDAAQWRDAQGHLAQRTTPPRVPEVVLDVPITPERDQEVETTVDLRSSFEEGRTYLVRLSQLEAAFDAPTPQYPSWSAAQLPHMAILTLAGEDALAVHARTAGGETVVHVSKMLTGEPVPGAEVALLGRTAVADAFGVAVFETPGPEPTGLVAVTHDGQQARLPLGVRKLTQVDLAPELSHGEPAPSTDVRALVISDRGIYRPGSTLHFKAMLRRPTARGELQPLPYLPVQLRLVAPSGKEVDRAVGLTDDLGSFSADFDVAAPSELGRWQATVSPLLNDVPLATTQVQVAEFEPPRFKVDVRAEAEGRTLRGEVDARYLFGAAMEGAAVTWTLRRSAAPLPRGPLPARGLDFVAAQQELEPWMRSGSGELDATGALAVEQGLELAASGGPQRFTLEAEVTDESHRAIAGRQDVVVHPHEAYAGVRLAERWPAPRRPLPLELGVVDTEGRTVAGRRIAAELVRLAWKRVRRPGPGGATHVDWKEVREVVDRCTTVSAIDVVACDLVPPESGAYEVTSAVDGRPGGTARLWAWADDSEVAFDPGPGHRLELETEASEHTPGAVATVLARNPFPRATALFSVEQGDVLHRETRVVEAGPVRFEFEVEARHVPHVHATVTLLPIGTDRELAAEWKLGVVRMPVTSPGSRLQVAVASDAEAYEPGQRASIKVAVRREGAPVAGAEVALAVVDEGVLRLTDFHAADPESALRPGVPLRFELVDTRHGLAELLERSHVAGDGAASGNASLVSTRKSFVETALWKPDLRTDARGEAVVDLDLPDNLTQFRMMAVVLDREGHGGSAEAAFEVRKPLMGVPVVPRFALAGDRFEAAIMVHSGLDHATEATVELDGREEVVALEPLGRKRVAFELTAEHPGPLPLRFTIRDAEGTTRDQVEVRLPVQAPGIDERPRLAGAFTGAQDILLQVPSDARTDLASQAFVEVTLGHDMWPELGARLEYLVDYPHGCLEQTTSGTLPLLAARDMLPRLGFVRYTEPELRARIEAGLARLASMRTDTGGLGYWPGDPEPNVYGTAYAMRAVALAAQVGIASQPGLLDEMAGFLERKLLEDPVVEPHQAEIKASIALALAEAERLPESSADLLMDTADHQQGPFGLASLALALSTLPDQEARVSTLLDRIEEAFDATGRLTAVEPGNQLDYYGSPQRTRAQCLLALARLRPSSTLVAILTEAILRDTGDYTTQGTAFGLLALRERLHATTSRQGVLMASVDGQPLTPVVDGPGALAEHGARYRVALEDVAGRNALLRLSAEGSEPVSFLVQARWRRSFDPQKSLAATSEVRGPDVYRTFTDPTGRPVDLRAIAPGQVLRVAVVAQLPTAEVDATRLGYLAITDRIPAGFEPIQPDLWTVSRPPSLDAQHPWHGLLQWGSPEASHVELRDDRVHLYFDRVYGEHVAGSYLVRATTPGRFVVPPTMAELMYEPESTGYGDAVTVEVRR